MTTIVYDGKLLAADTRISGFGRDCRGLKIYRHERGDLMYFFALSGLYADFPPAVIWYLDKQLDPDGFVFESKLVVVETNKRTKDTHCFLIEAAGTRLLAPTPWAEGSGAAFALGALTMGATAQEAIEGASLYDMHTNDTITSIDVATGKWIDAPGAQLERGQEVVFAPWLRKLKKARK